MIESPPFRHIGLAIPLILILSTSLRPAFKYGDGLVILVLYLVIVAALLAVWASVTPGNSLRRITSSWTFHGGMIIGWLALSVYFYPLADALKLQRLGQDQDDCLISGSIALLRFENPYLEPTYFGNPCSPLPGAILPYVPFVALGVFSIAGVFFLSLTVFAVGSQLGKVRSGLFLAILAGTPLVLELLVNGSDFIFIGCALVVLGLVIENTSYQSRRWLVFFSAVLAGLISSTRINMPIVLVFFVILLLLSRARGRFTAIGISILVSVGPAALIYVSNPYSFTPLHLLSKGQKLLPGWTLFAVLLVTAICLSVVFLSKKVSEKSVNFKLLLVTAPSVVSLSFADLASRSFEFAIWEGASYLMIIIPALSLLLAQNLAGRVEEIEGHHPIRI